MLTILGKYGIIYLSRGENKTSFPKLQILPLTLFPKSFKKNFKKGVDKRHKVCYNKSTERERKVTQPSVNKNFAPTA